MEIDTDKIDDAVLALLWLTLHNENRAWKGFDWDALDRLHEKDLIENPANEAKSVVLTDEGLQHAEAQFHKLFTRHADGPEPRRVSNEPLSSLRGQRSNPEAARDVWIASLRSR